MKRRIDGEEEAQGEADEGRRRWRIPTRETERREFLDTTNKRRHLGPRRKQPHRTGREEEPRRSGRLCTRSGELIFSLDAPKHVRLLRLVVAFVIEEEERSRRKEKQRDLPTQKEANEERSARERVHPTRHRTRGISAHGCVGPLPQVPRACFSFFRCLQTATKSCAPENRTV